MQTIKKVLNQTFWQSIGKAINVLTTILVLSAITRNYGEEGTGINTLSLVYLSFFYLACDFGLNQHFLRRISRHPSEINKLFNARVIWSLFLACLAISLIPIMPFSNYQVVMSVIFGAGSIVFFGVFNSANLIFQRKLSYKYSSAASSAGGFALLLVVLLLIKRDVPVELLMFGTLTGWVVTALIALFFVQKFYSFRIDDKLNFKFIKETIKATWPISATLIINTIYFRADTFILSSYRSLSEVGNYNLAYQVFQNLIVLPTFIMNGFYPLLLRSQRENLNIFIRQFRMGVLIMLGLGIFMMILAYLFSPLIIKILTGSGFLGSQDALRILSYSLPGFYLSSFMMWILLLFNKYKQMFFVYTIGFLVNIILNFIYIPTNSFYAAAWVTGISEYLILALQLIILLPIIGSKYRSDK